MVKKIEKPFLELHKIAVRVAKNIHLSDDVEHGRTIDKYGDVIKYVGGVDWVDIDINQDTRIIIHNHPNEYKTQETFSDYDIYNFLSRKYLCENIVCGYGYYFYLKRGTYEGLSADISSEVVRIRAKVKREVMKEYLADISNDSKTPKVKTKEMNIKAEKKYHNELCVFLSGKGLSYGKVKL